MGSAKRERHRQRRALGRAAKAAADAKTAAEARSAQWPKRTRRPCERCGQGCRTDKPIYGWVCANCAYELDQYLVIRMGLVAGNVAEVYESAKRRGELPPPGPRGPGVNVRKPM